MSVIPLTLSISLCLVFTFVVFFLREQARRSFRNAEHETLLPVAGDASRRGAADLSEPPTSG